MTATQSLPETPLTAQVAPRLPPKFQDGTINMRELVRQLAESMADEIMSAARRPCAPHRALRRFCRLGAP